MKLSKEQFKKEYLARSGISERWLDNNFEIVECNCEMKGCQGWRIVPTGIACGQEETKEDEQ